MFFPLVVRESNMKKFIKNCQGGMSVEYRLKLTQISKHATTMVAGSLAKINKFVMRILDLVVNEYRLAMLIPGMDISNLTVHAE